MSRLCFIILIISLIANCGQPQVKKSSYYPAKNRFSDSDKNKLVYVSKGYLGVPYRYGGTGKQGFDCSGFVYRIYLDALNSKFPRTTKKLYQASYDIPVSHAQTGDLVFFRIKGGRLDHVGMMLNKSRFIHTSKSKGVIVSYLGENYYWKRFAGIRRLR